jgi:hypothetical protein
MGAKIGDTFKAGQKMSCQEYYDVLPDHAQDRHHRPAFT